MQNSQTAVYQPFRISSRTISYTFLAIVALVVFPLWGSDYWFNAVLIPLLVFSLAGLGLNVLTGYAGQYSLGAAAFMAIGAFAAYNFQLRIPALSLPLSFVLGGLTSALFGILIGLPSLRIKGFYLLVSTLAAQFFVPWFFTKFSWFSNHSASGVITAPPLTFVGQDLSSPVGRYLLTLAVVLILTWITANLLRSDWGRHWMAVRDMDTAAVAIGIPVLKAKLLAFAVSSFLLGVAGSLWAFTYLGTVEPHGFDLARSFQILFIIIIGGMGSLIGSFLGAAFIVFLPIFLSYFFSFFLNGMVSQAQLENSQKIIFGLLILIFLIKEPEGLARLWQLAFEKLRIWPLRHMI